MALATQISALATRVAAEIKTLRASLPTWSTITGKPDFVAAGDTPDEAREAIGLTNVSAPGTFGLLTIATQGQVNAGTATFPAVTPATLQAKLNAVATWDGLAGKPAVVAAGANTAAAREAIGALPAAVFGVAGIVVDPETTPPDGWLIIRTT